MVELPATIASDQAHAGSEVRTIRIPVLKLLAALEIIDKVYPALDTAGVRGDVEALADHLMDGEESGTGAKPDGDAQADTPAAPELPAPAPNPAATPVLASEVSVDHNGVVGGPAPAEAPAAAPGAEPAAPSAATGVPVTTAVPVTTEPSQED
jgi:hypothetical protein